MKIFDLYMFKNLSIATVFIAVILAVIVFLTQSLRFLELVLNAGSSSGAFWMLTMLALPRFFEVILPISIMAATLFLYNKMTVDSEITAMRATGYSSFALGRPAMILATLVTTLLWIIAMWITPLSIAKMQKMRTEMTSEFSSVLFREGIFNQLGNGLTVYIKERTSNGELAGLMIYDSRDETKPPSTILAKRGIIVANHTNQQVIVYEGSRQEFNEKTGILQRLAFERYTIDLPSNSATDVRWSEPEERTITELLKPDMSNESDIKSLRGFRVEIHRRIASPLLAMSYALIALSFLLLGQMERRGQAKRITAAVIMIIIIQGLFLTTYNMSKSSDLGVILMYALSVLPVFANIFILSGWSENARHKLSTLLHSKIHGSAS